jgi:hypothetical protein
MVRFRLALCLLAPVLAGCYSERLPPPNFRYACGGDGDCNDNERCISGLCQVPCTQANADDDCPTSDGFATCFNGVCVSSCELPAEVCEGEGENEVCERRERRGTCTKPHMCLDLGIELGGGGSFFGGVSDVDVGVCGEWCTEGSCPEGEVCVAQLCVATCDPAGPDTCNAAFGLTCQNGLCLPQLDGATASDTDLPTSDGTSMTTDAPTSDSTASEGGSG